jgi:predicted nucleic acid-binding protein
MPQVLVLDTSVAAKWYLNDEELVDIAEQFLIRLLSKDIEFYAPELLRYELAESLYKAQIPSTGKFSREYCERSYRHFCELPIKFHHFNNDEMQQVLEFTNRFNKPFYDSCYVWLAEKLDSQWFTNDEKYTKSLPEGFPEERILLLKSLQ